MPRGTQPLNLDRAASRPALSVLQRFEVLQTLEIIVVLRAILTISFINDDHTYGTRDHVHLLLQAVDTCIALGYWQLAARRSLSRSLLYTDRGHSPTFATIGVNLCKELFRFELPHLITMAQALGLYGKQFRIPTGHSASNNWYAADGETILLALLYRMASPGRLVSMVPMFKCGTSKLSAMINFGIDWIYDKFIPHTNNICNWENHLGACAEHMEHAWDSPFDGLVGFVDGTLIGIARPNGESVFANSFLDQQNYYNGNHRQDLLLVPICKHTCIYTFVCVCRNLLIDICTTWA